jgi:ubiquinone/menaquinone biosynthesis C-methylase UbiE
MSEHGPFYGTFVDPVLKRMRKRVALHIEHGQTVLDVACGTGAQIFELAGKANKVVGFDYSESMISRAIKTKNKKGFSSAEFRVHDATEEWPFHDYQFDVAILSLALHQFSPKSYFVILNEMKRVAARQVFVDYAIPLPQNLIGTGSKLAEFLAGRDHNRNFKHYSRLGGLPVILPRHKFDFEKEEFFAGNVFQLVLCS